MRQRRWRWIIWQIVCVLMGWGSLTHLRRVILIIRMHRATDLWVRQRWHEPIGDGKVSARQSWNIKDHTRFGNVLSCSYLYCWSICAFSMRLSLARRFWNQIFICVSVNCKHSANSKRLPRDMYSLRWNSTSSRRVCSLLNVVRCRRGLPSFRRRRATAMKFSSIY